MPEGRALKVSAPTPIQHIMLIPVTTRNCPETDRACHTAPPGCTSSRLRRSGLTVTRRDCWGPRHQAL
eukprot:3048211-Rhodomonas_salina.2